MVSDIPLMDLAKAFSDSGYFPHARKAEQALTIVVTGRELGFGDTAALRGIRFIDGSLTMLAGMMSAAVKKSNRYDYRITELTNDCCRIEFIRTDTGEVLGESKFTMTDAKLAGLSGGKNYQHHPRNMLFARAMSNGVKWYTPDVMGGAVYTPDELGAEVDPVTGEAAEKDAPKPEARTAARRATKAPAPAATKPETKEDLQDALSAKMEADVAAKMDALKRLEALCAKYALGDVQKGRWCKYFTEKRQRSGLPPVSRLEDLSADEIEAIIVMAGKHFGAK